MIYKLIIHLKNVIFLKFVVYGLILGTLISLIPVLQKHLAYEKSDKKRADNSLQHEQFKLDSILTYEKNLLNNKNKLKRPKNYTDNCLNRADFVNKVKLLQNEYQLSTPINIKTKFIAKKDNILNISNNVQILHYETNINFKSADYQQSQAVLEKIFQLMPNGSVILNTKLEQLEALTPSLIKHLKKEKSIGLVDNNIKIMLQEINYDQ